MSSAQNTRGRCLAAHFLSVFSASSFVLSRKSISGTRPEYGQPILTTISVPGHRLDVAPSTTVDLPATVGSRKMTSPRLTVSFSCDPFPENSSWFPFCTTLLSPKISEFFTSSVLLEARVSGAPFYPNERQWKAMMLAMNPSTPSPLRKVYRGGYEDHRMVGMMKLETIAINQADSSM